MAAHLNEDAGPVLDMLAKELHREVFCLDEEGIAALRALRSNARLKPFGTMDLPLSCASLGDSLLLRQPLAQGVA